MSFDFQPLGDSALRIQVGDRIDPSVHRRVRVLCRQLEHAKIPGVVEWIPTYCAVTVMYHPHQIGYQTLCQYVQELREEPVEDAAPTVEVIHLPVIYGGDWGPDLISVAKLNGLSMEEVIRIHSEKPYLVYMMGFVPGFPYLGGMSPKIAASRLAEPRPRIPAGSVGIAGIQTGVYPLETPGGWRLIGHTPVPLYDPDRERPILLEAGQYVKFDPVDEEGYRFVCEQVKNGSYQTKKSIWKQEEVES
jgi:inhibitor of KinA